MKHYKNISVQDISWVKSNRRILEKIKGVDNLYYPETLFELIDLVAELEQPALSVTLTLYITLAAVAFMFVGVTVIVDELVGVNPEVAPDGTVCAIH